VDRFSEQRKKGGIILSVKEKKRRKGENLFEQIRSLEGELKECLSRGKKGLTSGQERGERGKKKEKGEVLTVGPVARRGKRVEPEELKRKKGATIGAVQRGKEGGETTLITETWMS